MRAIYLAIVLLAQALSAGERPVVGGETLLGDATVAPMRPAAFDSCDLASDGDEILFVWMDGGSLYAQRLNRHGNPLTAFPRVLLQGQGSWGERWLHRVLWLDGLYCIFFTDTNRSLSVMRLTRDAEIVDVRVLHAKDGGGQIITAGDEILILTSSTLLRLRADLSVISATPRPQPALQQRLAASPRGTLILTLTAPAISARFLDDVAGSGVRVGSAEKVGGGAMAWTGTELVAVWTDCPYSYCTAWMARFDEQLRPKGDPFKIGDSGDAAIGLAPAADDTVLVMQSGSGTSVRRFRRGVALDGSFSVGHRAVAFLSSQGTLFLADAKLKVYATASNAATAPLVVAEPQAAAAERILDVASSPDGVAIARQRLEQYGGVVHVTLTDGDGKAVRDVQLSAPADSVALASDGRDFYALIGSSRFQKVEQDAPLTALPFRAVTALAWTGTSFVTMQRGWNDGQRYYGSTWLRWLDRNGEVVIPRCSPAEIRTEVNRATFVPGRGGEMLVAADEYLVHIENDCPAGPPRRAEGPLQRRVAWQNGTWAALISDPYPFTLRITFSDDPAAFTGPRHRLATPDWTAPIGVDIAAVGGRWLVSQQSAGGTELFVVDGDGSIIGRGTLPGARNVRLLSAGPDRVMAVYTRMVWEPPFLGVSRIAVAPVTLETAFRRRAVRS